MIKRRKKENDQIDSEKQVISEEMIIMGLRNSYEEVLSSNDFETALQIALKLTELTPDDFSVWFLAGNAYTFLGNYHSAIESYEKGIALYEVEFPFNPQMSISLAFAYYHIEDFDKVLEATDKILESEPEFASALGLQGLVSLKRNKLTKAYRLLIKSKEKLSEQFMFWDGLIRIYIERDEMDKAIEAAKEYLELFPRKEAMWFVLGDLYFNEDNFEEAQFAYKKAHSIDINDLEILGKYIVCLGVLKKYDDVIYYSYQLLQKNPTDVTTLSNIAQAYKEKGIFNSALEYITKAISILPDEPSIQTLFDEIVKLNKVKKSSITKVEKEEPEIEENNSKVEFLEQSLLEDEGKQPLEAARSMNQKKETKQILEYFSNAAVNTNKKLSLEEKIDYLINFDVLPLYIPALLELNSEEINQMVDNYQRKLSQKSYVSLQKLPERYDEIPAKITKKQKEGSNKLTEKGWTQLHSANDLIGPKQKEGLLSTAEIFIDALILNPEHIAALIGIGLSLNLASDNIHEAFEWLAKAYALNPDLTVKILVEQRYYPQLEKLFGFVENFI
ncbi:MAG: tetratricopeptide repeat protein [Asgard group archaeon]|nr:tetratricopeptide repeat protein [Asgard group archaeon]